MTKAIQLIWIHSNATNENSDDETTDEIYSHIYNYGRSPSGLKMLKAKRETLLSYTIGWYHVEPRLTPLSCELRLGLSALRALESHKLYVQVNMDGCFPCNLWSQT